MRVLMIEHFAPGNTYTFDLCRELSRYVDITMLCPENADNILENVEKKTCFYSGGYKNKLKAVKVYLWGVLCLYKELRSRKYDVVHVQTFRKPEIEIPIYIHMRRSVPLVHTVHNVLPHEKNAKDKELYEHFYQICDILITHNIQSKKKLMELFGINERKILVIPHGAYKIKKSTTKKVLHEKTHYLIFGEIRKYKGIDILLQAISMLPEPQRFKMEFIIAGRQFLNQDETDYNGMIKEFHLEDCVKLLPRRIEDEELSELFNWADACVFAYREVYGSGALLMAYAYNKPVIVSDIPSFIEETDHGRTGLLFKNCDAKELSKVLWDFSQLDKRKIEEMRSCIQDLVKTKYNWAVSAKMTEDAYKVAIKN